jgi:acyl-CoA synthetase (AMP-forming)/AMP-acid ligase II
MLATDIFNVRLNGCRGAAVVIAATLVDLLRKHAEQRPDQTSFVFLADGEQERARVSFGELERRAAAVASLLGDHGMRGQRAVLMFASGLEFIAAFFGCLAAGVVAVPVAPPRRVEGAELALRIIRAADARRILVDAEIWQMLAPVRALWPEGIAIDVLDWLDRADEVAARAGGRAAHVPRPDDLAFLQFTSGSTGDPKGVAVSHGNLLANQRVIERGFGHGEHTTVVSWLPFHHDMGLVGMVMQPLYLGRPCVLMPPDAFIKRPLRWLKAISRYCATTSGAPTFGYQRCLDGIADADLERAGLDLASWEVAYVGAEPVRSACLDGFARRLAPTGFQARAVYPCYGLAEATLMVTGVVARSGLAAVDADPRALGDGRCAPAGDGEPHTRLVSCGRPWGDDIVAIVDPTAPPIDRQPLPDNAVGEIWVSGPSVAGGYWERPDETEEVFGATSPAFPDRRFLRTGDLGFIRNGDLYIAGRLKDLLIINGRNHYPQDIEATVIGLHPAFRPQAAVFSDDDLQHGRVVLVQGVYPHWADKIDLRDATQLVRREVGAVHEVGLGEIVFTTSRLPTTTSGKIRRRACREAWRAGQLKPVTTQGAPRDRAG